MREEWYRRARAGPRDSQVPAAAGGVAKGLGMRYRHAQGGAWGPVAGSGFQQLHVGMGAMWEHWRGGKAGGYVDLRGSNRWCPQLQVEKRKGREATGWERRCQYVQGKACGVAAGVDRAQGQA